MIDYRPIIVQYIKDKTGLTNVKDGTLTFKQPNGDYAIYYIIDEDEKSFVNNIKQEVNVGDATLIDETYDPLTTSTIQIDIRGENSFINSRNLYKSFGTINNKKILREQGVFFIMVSGISPLPQVKNTLNEEGYIFELTISFDNSFIETSTSVGLITLDGTTT